MRIDVPPPAKPTEVSPEPAPDNVLHVNFGQQSEIDSARRLRCHHHSYKLNSRERTVTCSACDAQLDAFEVLLDYARAERNWRNWDTERLKQMAQLDELKAEERKIKARTRAASRKEADAAVAHERARSEKERFEIIQAARDIGELVRRIERTATRRRTV